MTARVINLVLGLWLFVSSFLWDQPRAAKLNGITCGALCMLFAALSMKKAGFKYLNTALSLWLFFTAFSLGGYASATVWNHYAVAVGIFVFSLAPAEPQVPLFRLQRPFFRRPRGPQPV